MECTLSAVTEFVRTKPFVFGVGLEKCGTSSLHGYISKARNVSVPWPKELEFFASNRSTGLDWYLAHYDLRKDILFDFTPTYHWRTACLERIEQISSNSVILVMLRDPIARAYSAFIHRLYWFFEAGYAEGRIRGYDMTFGDVVNAGDTYVLPSYVETIDRVESVFGVSRVVVIPLDSFLVDPRRFVNAIEDKLDCRIALPEGVAFPRNNSLTLPQFFLGRDILERNPTAKDLISEPDDVYFCRGGFPRRIAKSDDYESLKKMEAKWLVPFGGPPAADAFSKYYRDETHEIGRRAGVELTNWGQDAEFHPKTVEPLSEAAARANIDVEIWRARKLYLSGQRQNAIETVKNAIEREPGEPQYHRLLAWMNLEDGEAELADEQALVAISQAPANAEYLLFRRYVLNRIKIGASLDDDRLSHPVS
jgi:hypothetical protein